MAVLKRLRPLKYEHIILCHFKARDLEIPLILIAESMNTLRNFAKSVFVHIFKKFTYFAKQFI